MSTTLPRPAANFDDDLFHETKMSFGEHLNELRICLFKAVIALAIGTAIGLLFGERVVKMVETPLTKALEDYYKKSALDSIKAKLAARREAGESIPPQLEDEKVIDDLVLKRGLLFEETFVMPEELFNELKQQQPKLFGGLNWPAATVGKPAAQPGAAAAAPTAAPAASKLLRLYLWHPADEDDRIKIKALGVQETFMIYMKAAFISGAIIASPAVFYFVWSFVAAGLYSHEKRYVHVFLPASVILFLLGAGLAFFFVFEPVLNFLFSFNRSMGIDPDPRISEWLSFVLLLPLGFGVSFQLPLAMLFLERIGIFNVEAYLSKWRIAVIGIAIVSMVFNGSGDPYSMMMLFIPLTFLYFGGVALCYFMSSGRAPRPPASGASA